MSTSSNPWTKFFWNDYETDPKVKLCSLAAQGLWMRMLCICAKSRPVGFLSLAGRPLTIADVARLAGEAPSVVQTLIEELELNGVFSRDRNQCIYSRRMVSDEKKSKTNAENGKKGGDASVGKQRGIFQSPKRKYGRKIERDPEPHKPEAISQKEKLKESPPKMSLVEVGNACLEAVGGDPARFMGTFSVIADLQRQGASPDELIEAAKRIGSRPNFQLRGNPMGLLGKALPEELEKLRNEYKPPDDGIDPRWRLRANAWFKKLTSWSESMWGPPPDHPRTDVPKKVRDELGIETRKDAAE